MKLGRENSMRVNILVLILVHVIVLLEFPSVAHSQPPVEDAVAAMHRAVSFFRDHASAGGGYIFQLSDDLAKREGEGVVGPTTAWIEPPSTPSVGMAYLEAYQLTRDPILLEASRETARALLRGQLRSGGWDNRIEFAKTDRQMYAYRVDGGTGKKLRNTTTFDDDKSQSVIRFLMQFDRELEFKEPSIHEAVIYALDGILKSQFPNGAWPQRYSAFANPDKHTIKQARLPETWPREFPGSKYSGFYTLNDNTMSDLIVTALDAWEIYRDPRYLVAAEKGGDFLLRAQLPEPQPGWAQQYDPEMRPAWARKFEPPAITGGESQGVMRTLILLYRRTAATSTDASRFLEPLPRAIAYYRRSLLKDGRLARFYELGSNRPLFFTKDYKLTYSDDDMPTHYGFVVGSKLDRIETDLRVVRQTSVENLWRPRDVNRPKPTRSLAKSAKKAIDSLDTRGAWVESGSLKYHKKDDPTRRVIRSDTFIKNLGILANWIAANK